MPASQKFVDDMLDVIDKHITAFGGDDQAKVALCFEIADLPSGRTNKSVWRTQVNIRMAAHERWQK